MVTTPRAAIAAPEISAWRFRLGVVLFVLVLPPYTLIAPLILRDLSLPAVATIAAGLVVAQNLLVLAAIAVLGKPGFLYIKSLFVRRVATLAPAREVGPLRHRIGIVMFCLPFIFDWIETYAIRLAALFGNRIWVDVGGDLLLIASLFVLGGNFWDKLHALFVREATACFPADAGSPAE